jgi:actin-related protein
MGESKTSVSVVDDGELVCQTDFVCGGYHIVQTLLWTMYQSSLSVEGLSTDIHINDRDAIRSIFESQCHGEQKKEEVFRSVEITYARQSKLYKMQVGDPLYIAILAYFYPKVLGKNKQQGPTGVVLNDIVDGEAEDYTLAEKEDFNSRSNLKNLSSAPIKYEAGEENGDPLQPETTKKKRAASAKKAVSATAGKTKSKTVPSLERVIIKMLKKSGMEFTKGKDKDSKKQKVNILLIGGCSMIKDFSELLKVRLEEYLTTKLKVTNCAINITSNDRDKGTNVKYLSWTGGCILNQLESAKEMWITKEEYKRHGHRVIYERAPL